MARAMIMSMLINATSLLTKGELMNRSTLTRKRSAARPVQDKLSKQKRAPSPAGSAVGAHDDARVWDIMGRVMFSPDSGNPPPSSWTPLPGGPAEADDETEIWDI